MANYFEYVQPHPALKAYFRLYNVFRMRMDEKGGDAGVKSVWPSRYCWLVFNPSDNSCVELRGGGRGREPRTALVGHSTRVVRKWYAGPDWFRVQVQLQPGALFRLTGIPSREFNDTEIDADAVFPAAMRHVSDLLAEARSVGQITAILESFLFQWVRQCTRRVRPIDRAIELMAHDASIVSLDRVTDVACLSNKQFYRAFIQRMGVGPNLYLRIARMARAFAHKASQADVSWADAAECAGYYDYQHMAKDYRLMTGQLPTQALACEHQSPEARFAFSSRRIW